MNSPASPTNKNNSGVPNTSRHSSALMVVGSGPTGMRFCQELLKRQPQTAITLFSGEPYLPYNRVQLSPLLAGEVHFEDIISPLPQLSQHPQFEHIYARIKRINCSQKTLLDQHHNTYEFDRLVLATGSRPVRPNIPGVGLCGVYSFRDIKDTEALYSRTLRARHVVVVGGGLLGLEAAHALQRHNTQVTVLHQSSRLMNRQLDPTAAQCLDKKVKALGIGIIINSGVQEIIGDQRVSGVVTKNGQHLACDTVVLCTGITPVTDLAENTPIKTGRGILVNDQLQTSEPGIFAIGECCEHRGKTYGLVNPCFEQAAICAAVIAEGHGRYFGSLEISRLKVLGEPVFSMGQAAEPPASPFLRQLEYHKPEKNIYRKLVICRGQLVGAIGFGEWSEAKHVQEAYQHKYPLRFWHYLRFKLTGAIWAKNLSDNPGLWPAATVVCECNNISQGQLVQAIDEGVKTTAALSKKTNAGTTCGSCTPTLDKLLGQTGTRVKDKAWQMLLVCSLVAIVFAGLILFTPALQVSNTSLAPAALENIWNNKLWKQITGFTLVGFCVAGLLMSLRKRFKFHQWGAFGYWRLLHVALGVVSAVILITHTGLHLGENLNRWLMVNFLTMIAVGAAAGAAISLSHKLNSHSAKKLRSATTWAHILVAWPLPALLAIHIITVYYF